MLLLQATMFPFRYTSHHLEGTYSKLIPNTHRQCMMRSGVPSAQHCPVHLQCRNTVQKMTCQSLSLRTSLHWQITQACKSTRAFVWTCRATLEQER